MMSDEACELLKGLWEGYRRKQCVAKSSGSNGRGRRVALRLVLPPRSAVALAPLCAQSLLLQHDTRAHTTVRALWSELAGDWSGRSPSSANSSRRVRSNTRMVQSREPLTSFIVSNCSSRTEPASTQLRHSPALAPYDRACVRACVRYLCGR
jgi:hypothetical protein